MRQVNSQTSVCVAPTPPAGCGRVRQLRQMAGLFFLSMLISAKSYGATDSVTMNNGDRLTGEIKSLDRGILFVDPDYSDTIEITWEHVATLVSTQTFEVILEDGARLFGTLVEGATPSALRLSMLSEERDLPMLMVVRMNPIEERVIERIEMSVDIGYSLTKANDAEQSTLGYDFRYRDELRLLSLNADASTSTTENDSPSTRANTSLNWRRFLDGREWDPVAIALIERNDELGIDRRIAAGGGMSRWITDTNTNRIAFFGGVVYGREDANGVEGTEGSIEATLGLTAEWFRYDEPELDVSTRFSVFERLTDASRTRGNLDVDFRWELFSDSFWGFNIYYSFDSAPESATASKRDYGIVTSVGWDF
jgi:hypothetical protein